MPLPTRFRLNLRHSGDDFFTHSRKLHHSLFTFYISENKLGYPRFSFVVPKKVGRLAVKRNLLRRQLTGIIGPQLSNLKLNLDIAIILKSPAMSISYEELESAITATLATLS